MPLNVHCSAVYNSQYIDATKISIDRFLDKEDVVHICGGILLSHKDHEITAVAALWMDL